MNVQIDLKSSSFNLAGRIEEVMAIREWITELVCWDESLFKISFHSSKSAVIVWFENDEHATMCALRWS